MVGGGGGGEGWGVGGDGGSVTNRVTSPLNMFSFS